MKKKKHLLWSAEDPLKDSVEELEAAQADELTGGSDPINISCPSIPPNSGCPVHDVACRPGADQALT